MTNLAEKLLADPDLLKGYKAGLVAAADLAQQFGVQQSYVLTTLSRLGARRDPRPTSTYQQQRRLQQLAGVRREFRQVLARRVAEGALSLALAAETAGCSERTMRRYVKEFET